jgi:hypothetical protein
LREGNRARALKNRALRRIFWPKMNKVTEEYGRLH